jgi:pyruvate, water dikinase
MDPRLMPVPLEDARDPRVFGGKAVSLGTGLRAGLPIPPGVALAPAVVERVVLERELDGLGGLSERIPAARMAVRSSAIGEDSHSASFAGQHATVLNVAAGGLPDAIRAVWQSGRSEAALAYRRRHGIVDAPSIAVVVQALIEPVVAGVMFTRDPVTGADERLIEAAWGLGEAVVSGLVVPDRFRMHPDGTVLEMQPGHKDVKIWYDGRHGTTQVPVPGDQHHVLTLGAADLAQLHALVERCIATWGPDLDVEWAFDARRTLYLLQARPITTVQHR